MSRILPELPEYPRTFVERYNHWRCPRCGTWCDEPSCPALGCNHKRVHVARVVYECQSCLCIATAADIYRHDCDRCML